MNDRARVVDVDDPSTWPAAVVEALDAGPEQFPEELNCYRLRAYHCTTLLGHELETVCEQGLGSPHGQSARGPNPSSPRSRPHRRRRAR